MELNPGCSLCVHGAEIVTTKGKRFGSIAPFQTNCIVSCEEVLRRGGGFFATNSIFAPMHLAKKTPQYFDTLSLDWVWIMYFASQGYTYYMSEIMSAYRKGGKSSWSYKTAHDLDYEMSFKRKYVKVREEFDASTNYKYHEIIQELNEKTIWEIALFERNDEFLSTPIAMRIKQSIPKSRYRRIIIRFRHPVIFYLMSCTKRVFNSIIR